MSSPNPPHTLKLEMYLNAAWTDITGDFLSERQPAQITRGFSSETSKKVDPASLRVLLDNRSKNYSPRRAASIYYGTLKKNTPIRLSVTSAGTNYRFWGELADITPSADQSGVDLTTSLAGGGLMRRLNKGGQPVKSLPRSYIPTTSPTAYWPLEDGALSVQATPITGVAPLVHLGTLTQGWATGTLAPWLPSTLQGKVRNPLTSDARFVASVPAQGFSTGWTLDYLVHGRTDYSILIGHTPTVGSTDSWGLSMSPSVDNILVTPPAGSVGGGSTTYIHDGLFHHVRFRVIENSIGNSNYFVYVDGVVVATGLVTAAGPEPVIDVLQVDIDLNDHQAGSHDTDRVTIGHVAFYASASPPAIATMVSIAQGNPGEAAGTRMSRLCVDQGITLTAIGTLSATKPCGPQYNMGLVDLLQECADVDGGLLYETLDSVGFTYRTLDSIYNKTVDLPLTYTTNHHLGGPLVPVDDDQVLRNDVTVTRKGGSPEQVTQTTGPLSTSPPPTGVGKYDTAFTIACLTQAQAKDQAGWIALNVGTQDAARYPSIKLDMNTLPLTQRALVMAMNVGARVTITSPPAWLPPDQIDLLVVGFKETITRYKWDMELVCVPFAPYRVATADSATLARAAPDDGWATVTTTTTATSWSVDTASGPIWTTAAADFPFDLNVEGERVTVTNITGGATPQTFAVTRSVNTVVKAHTAAVVSLWQPMIAPL